MLGKHPLLPMGAGDIVMSFGENFEWGTRKEET
jgi:hypothetical protein